MVEVEQIVNVKIVINVQLLKLAKNRNVMVYVNISDNAGICIDSDQSSSKDISSLDYKSLKLSSEYNWITSSETESEKNSIKYIILSYYMFLVYINIIY